MGTVYDIIFPDTIYTYEAVLGDIVTKLMPGCVSSAGTAKQLVFPDVDFSPYSESLINFTFIRETRYAPGIYLNVHFKLLMHVSQRSPEAVPM